MIDPTTYTTRGLFCGASEIATKGIFTCDEPGVVVVIKKPTRTKRISLGDGGFRTRRKNIYSKFEYSDSEIKDEKYIEFGIDEEEEILVILNMFLRYGQY